MANQIIRLPFRSLKYSSIGIATGPSDAAEDGVAGHTAGNTFNKDPDNPNTGTFYMQTPSARGEAAIQLKMEGGDAWEDWNAGFYGNHNWRWRNEYSGDWYDERGGIPLPAEIAYSSGAVLLQPTIVGVGVVGNEARILWKADRGCESEEESPVTGVTTLGLSGASATSVLRDPDLYGGDGPHVRIRINKVLTFHINDQSCLPLLDGHYYLPSFPSSIDLASYGITEVGQIEFHVSVYYAYEGDWAWMRIGRISFA